MNPIRILHVDPERAFAGGETQVVALARHLRARGHAQAIATDPEGLLAAALVRDGFTVLPIACRTSLDPRAGLELRRIVRREHPDVVHLHTGRALSLAPYVPASVVRVVTRRMDYAPRGAGVYVRWLYGHADEIIAISSAVRQALLSRGIAAARIDVVPSGVEVERFQGLDRGRARARLDIAAELPVIALVGSLVRRKGQSVLLEALPRLADAGVKPFCLFAGVGADGDRLLEQADRLGVAAQTRWLGRVDDVAPVLAAADLVVAPSLAEGLGVAVIEAMAAGRPLVASAVGGIPETVRDGREGLLVPPGEVEPLAEAIGRCLGDVDLMRRFGEAGRLRAAKFSTGAMARGTESIYERALARRGGAGVARRSAGGAGGA